MDARPLGFELLKVVPHLVSPLHLVRQIKNMSIRERLDISPFYFYDLQLILYRDMPPLLLPVKQYDNQSQPENDRLHLFNAKNNAAEECVNGSGRFRTKMFK